MKDLKHRKMNETLMTDYESFENIRYIKNFDEFMNFVSKKRKLSKHWINQKRQNPRFQTMRAFG